MKVGVFQDNYVMKRVDLIKGAVGVMCSMPNYETSDSKRKMFIYSVSKEE
jgi:DNA-binding cell septation regulator SpoVG